jgi:hypothetical protein
MSKPARRVPTRFNRWLRQRDDHKEREEDRQVQQVLDALRELDTARDTNLSMPSGQTGPCFTQNLNTDVHHIENTDNKVSKTRREPQPVIRLVSEPRPRKKPDAETRVRRVLTKTPDASLDDIARRAKVGKPTAKRHRDAWLAEQQVQVAMR